MDEGPIGQGLHAATGDSWQQRKAEASDRDDWPESLKPVQLLRAGPDETVVEASVEVMPLPAAKAFRSGVELAGGLGNVVVGQGSHGGRQLRLIGLPAGGVSRLLRHSPLPRLTQG